MNAHQQEYFIVLAECLNFREAAEKLYITQPALSKQIAALEKELDVMLFVRDKRKGTRLTPAGAMLRDLLPVYESHYHDLLTKIRAAHLGFNNRLTIAVLDGHELTDMFRESLASLREEHPDLDIDLFRSNYKSIRKGIRDGHYDAAITLDFDIKEESDLGSLVIKTAYTSLAMSDKHPFASRQDLTIREIGSELIIFPEETKIGLSKISKEWADKGVKLNVRCARNISSVMLQVEAGMGVAVMNETTYIRRDPHIVFRPIVDIDKVQVMLIWNQNNDNHGLKWLVETVKANIDL